MYKVNYLFQYSFLADSCIAIELSADITSVLIRCPLAALPLIFLSFFFQVYTFNTLFVLCVINAFF